MLTFIMGRSLSIALMEGANRAEEARQGKVAAVRGQLQCPEQG